MRIIHAGRVHIYEYSYKLQRDNARHSATNDRSVWDLRLWKKKEGKKEKENQTRLSLTQNRERLFF